LVAKTYPTELDGAPMLTLASTPREPAALLLKRVIDVGCSATALTLLAPVLAAVAVVVRVNSRGPALFCQERVGLNGRLFRLYKFRSMYQNAEGCKEQIES
jgi:lipopolysaccharide/colanic/teichoic acid biosynthesis glycosyltransferase